MTQWGLDNLFNPGKRFMDDEKRRLQATREEVGDASGGRRIDLESGRVLISPRPKAGSKPASGPESASGPEADPDADAGPDLDEDLDAGAPADEDALTPDSAASGDEAVKPEPAPHPESQQQNPAPQQQIAAADEPDEHREPGRPASKRASAAAWSRRG